MIYEKMTDLIGNTPILKLGNLFLKLEYFNPTGSIKDRPVFFMLNGLANDTPIVEATSGNTGIALALFGKMNRQKVIIVMNEDVSIERINLIKLLGAKIHLIPKELGIEGAKNYALAYAKNHNYQYLDQFHNKLNLEAHRKTTSKEIIQDLKNEQIDYFISGIGSGGTLGGIFIELSKVFLNLKGIGVIPKTTIEGITKQYETCFILQELLTIQEITEEEIKEAVPFALEHGILAGPSGLANLKVALDIMEKEPDKKILTIIPDSIFKYLANMDLKK